MISTNPPPSEMGRSSQRGVSYYSWIVYVRGGPVELSGPVIALPDTVY